MLLFAGCGDMSVDLFPSLDGATLGDAARHGGPALDGAGAGLDADTPGCRSDADCTGSEATRCEPVLLVCVECIANADCASRNTTSVCNRVTNRCASPCQADTNCASPDVCDIGQGTCVECLDDSQCAESRNEKRCVEETCVQCASAQDCPSDTQCWQNACVACVTSADCPEGGTCSAEHVCD
jgi:Cys-rich repeat protein